MTGYTPPPGQGYGADQANLRHRVEMLERQIAQLTSGPVSVLSTGRPATPVIGQQILETDTGLTAQWNGTAWVYPPQLIARRALTSSSPSFSLTVPTGPAFSTLRAVWSARSDAAFAATYMLLQINSDTSSGYFWQINQVSATGTATGNEPGGLTTAIEVGTMAAATATANYLGSGELSIANASGSTYKAVAAYSTSSQTSTSGFSGTYGGQWLSTAAITSLTLFPLAGNLVAGSTVSLYGWT